MFLVLRLGRLVSKWELADMQARLYLNRGVTKDHIGEIDEAAEYYATAIKICKSNELFEMHHQCLMASGLLFHTRKNDTVFALNQINAAIEVAKRIQDKNEKMCESLLAKSELLVANADFQSVKQVLKKAYKLKTPNKSDKEKIQKNLRVVLTLCKCEDELVITDSFDYAKRKELFEKLGDATCKLKNYSKAIDYYLKMLEAAQLKGEAEKQMIPIYVSLYQTYIDQKDFDSALVYMNKEYELIQDDPKEACATLLGLGNVMDQAGKDFWEVDAMYRKGLAEAGKAEDSVHEKVLLQKLIALCRNRCMFSLAESLEQEATEKGIDLIESSDDAEYSEDIGDICNDISLELLLSSDPESSDNEQNRTPKPTRSTRKRRPAKLVKKNMVGESELHEACIKGQYPVVKMLIDKGHPVIIRDGAGWLPLHEAAIHGHRDIVELLLDNGSQSFINDRGGAKCDGITPLYDAAGSGHLSVVQLLLDRGAKATIRNDANQTPLDTLVEWYEYNGESLSAAERGLYDELKQRLTEQCERAGIDTTAKPENTGSSGYNSGRSRNSQSSQSRRSRRFNTSLSSESEDDEPEVEKENAVKKNARLEYKNVMARLKNSHVDQPRIEDSGRRKGGHMAPDEVHPDEWLEDDLGPSRKKQKLHKESSLDKSPAKASPAKTFARKPSSLVFDSDSDDNANNENIFNENAFDVVMNASGNSKAKPKRRSSATKTSRLSTSQPSLLESGFARFVEQPESVDLTNFASPKTSPLKPHSSFNESFSRPAEKQLIIKVLVEEEKIIVPVNRDAANDLQISWLIDEASRRYYW